MCPSKKSVIQWRHFRVDGTFLLDVVRFGLKRSKQRTPMKAIERVCKQGDTPGKDLMMSSLWHPHPGLSTRSHWLSLGHSEPSTLGLRGRWCSVMQSCPGSEKWGKHFTRKGKGKFCHFNSFQRSKRSLETGWGAAQPSMVPGLVAALPPMSRASSRARPACLCAFLTPRRQTLPQNELPVRTTPVTSGANVIALLVFCYSRCTHFQTFITKFSFTLIFVLFNENYVECIVFRSLYFCVIVKFSTWIEQLVI